MKAAGITKVIPVIRKQDTHIFQIGQGRAVIIYAKVDGHIPVTQRAKRIVIVAISDRVYPVRKAVEIEIGCHGGDLRLGIGANSRIPKKIFRSVANPGFDGLNLA